MLRLFLYIICFVILCINISGQIKPIEAIIGKSSISPDITFTHLTEKDGLSLNLVNGIVQDNEGIMWIATAFGLNRYDGQRFYVFKKDKNDPKSIAHNGISSLCKDLDGNIWGTTEDGIFCYDQKKKYFINYKTTETDLFPSTHSIVCDKNGQIWAASHYGLVKVDHKNLTYQYISKTTEGQFSVSAKEIPNHGILIDPNGKGIWISTSKGLNFYETSTNKFINFKNSKDSTIFNANSGINYLTMR
jgi:ligand-binding sensor domain-containing protein